MLGPRFFCLLNLPEFAYSLSSPYVLTQLEHLLTRSLTYILSPPPLSQFFQIVLLAIPGAVTSSLLTALIVWGVYPVRQVSGIRRMAPRHD